MRIVLRAVGIGYEFRAVRSEVVTECIHSAGANAPPSLLGNVLFTRSSLVLVRIIIESKAGDGHGQGSVGEHSHLLDSLLRSCFNLSFIVFQNWRNQTAVEIRES